MAKKHSFTPPCFFRIGRQKKTSNFKILWLNFFVRQYRVLNMLLLLKSLPEALNMEISDLFRYQISLAYACYYNWAFTFFVACNVRSLVFPKFSEAILKECILNWIQPSFESIRHPCNVDIAQKTNLCSSVFFWVGRQKNTSNFIIILILWLYFFGTTILRAKHADFPAKSPRIAHHENFWFVHISNKLRICLLLLLSIQFPRGMQRDQPRKSHMFSSTRGLHV